MEDCGSDLVAAGLDINAHGHKQVEPTLEIGLKPGQKSLGISLLASFAWMANVISNSRMALEWIGPFPLRPTRKLAMRCAPAHGVPVRKRNPSNELSSTIKGIFMKVDPPPRKSFRVREPNK